LYPDRHWHYRSGETGCAAGHRLSVAPDLQWFSWSQCHGAEPDRRNMVCKTVADANAAWSYTPRTRSGRRWT